VALLTLVKPDKWGSGDWRKVPKIADHNATH